LPPVSADILLGFMFNTEDVRGMFIRNVRLSPDFQNIVLFIFTGVRTSNSSI
jgi:hypothetical protein